MAVERSEADRGDIRNESASIDWCKEWRKWKKQTLSSCKLQRLIRLHDMDWYWKCNEPEEDCICKQAMEELWKEWVTTMNRSITPRLIGCMPPFASKSTGQISSVTEQDSFRIMDFPSELRELTWSFAKPHWQHKLMGTGRVAKIYGPPYLLQVSRRVCREAAPFVVFDLVVDHRECSSSCSRTDHANHWRRLEVWIAASAQCVLNQLSRLRVILIARGSARFEFTFVINPTGDLNLYEHRFPPEWRAGGQVWVSNEPVEKVVRAALEDTVQNVMRRKISNRIRGLRLFEGVLACKDIWEKLVDDNEVEMSKVMRKHLSKAARNKTSVGAVEPDTVYWRWQTLEDLGLDMDHH